VGSTFWSSPIFIGEKMEINIKTEELRKYSIFVATPMYGGMNHGLYMKACLDLQGLCMQYGIQVKFSFLFNESLITRARNYLVDEFLYRSDCTHMLFIDSDINFNPQDVIAMLALDKDVIGGPYPKKAIKWRSVKKAIEKNPTIDAQLLEKVAGDFVFNPVKGTAQFSVTEPLEVLEIGTGFMMIKREVFPKFAAQYPQLKYKPDHVGQANFDGTRYIHAYFDTTIDKNSERYLSEDYMFCQWWRNMGGTIWLCPWMRTAHIGTYHFHGDMPAVANYVGEM
jgi:hypothetical protein